MAGLFDTPAEPGSLQRDSQSTIAAALFGPIPAFKPYGTLAELFSRVHDFVSKHWDFVDERGYDVFASWVLATYLRDKWDAVPYLFFLGNAGTGKTRGLEIAQALAYRAILVSNISTAALFRVDEDFHPTLCLDETEYLSSEDRREIIGLINSRYKRGAISVRAGPKDESGKIGYEVFNVYGFTALAGTRGFLQTLESRCVIFYMQKSQRRLPITIDKGEAAELRAQLFQFQYDVARASDGFEAVTKSAFPLSNDGMTGSDGFLDMPLSGRSVELFLPLVTVAPPDARERIKSYALDVETRKNAEIAASDDALVYYAIKELHGLPSYSEKIPALVVKDKVNESFPEKEGMDSQHIGYALKRMGLQVGRTTDGKRYVKYDGRIMSRLAHQYGDTSGKPSLVGIPSFETPNDGLMPASKPSFETGNDDLQKEPSP